MGPPTKTPRKWVRNARLELRSWITADEPYYYERPQKPCILGGSEAEDAAISLVRLRIWDVASVIVVEESAMDVEVFKMDMEASVMEQTAQVTGLASWAE